jgi:glucose/arabinose dehydrogenase
MSIMQASSRRRPPVRTLALLGAVTSLLALLLGISGSASAAPANRPPHLTFALRASGFGPAVLVASSFDGTGRLFIVDKQGLVFSWLPGHSPTVYLDLRSRVLSSGAEQGLLGLAFYPDFRHVPVFFVTYTASDGSLDLSRFVVPGYTAGSVSASTEQHMLNVPHPTYTNHNAGMLVFGKDYDLYVSTGDGGGAGDPFDNSLNLGSLSGKILRLNIRQGCSGTPYYCIPPDNPFVHLGGARGQVWASGLRNPWRFSMDWGTGAFWIGDVGQARYEEVDVAPKSPGGLDYGWSCMEGYAVYNAARCKPGAVHVRPVAVIAHPTAEALIGGLVYRGPRYQTLMGPRYIFGDYITGTVWTMPGGGSPSVAGHLSSVTSFGPDQSGEVWATTLTGGLYQMVAS